MRLPPPTFENCAFAGIIMPNKLEFCRFALTGQQQLDKIKATIADPQPFQCPCRNHRHGIPVEKGKENDAN